MFERYTEKARRIIFFARYEASQFASPTIESEHLLLGLLREDKPLALRILQSNVAIEAIRRQIEILAPKHTLAGASVDLPLSRETKRILACGAEESERLNQRHIAPVHLLLGIFREPQSLAARILAERQVRYEQVRAYAAESRLESEHVPAAGSPSQALRALFAEREQEGGITVVTEASVAGYPTPIAIYEGLEFAPDTSTPSTPAQQIAVLRKKIQIASQYMEKAIAHHDFATARQYSDEERALREQLNQLERTLNPEEIPPSDHPVPFLCILILREESLLSLRARIEEYFRAGVENIWLLDPANRLYTATPAEGLREFLGDTLEIPHHNIRIPRASIL